MIKTEVTKLIEDLLYWEVRNKKLERFGIKIEEINKEFNLLHNNLGSGGASGLINPSRARGLLKKN